MSGSQPVKLPAIFAGIQSKVDRSYRLTFVTQELSGEDAAILLKMNQNLCWLVVAPDDSIDSVDVPDAKPDAGNGQKTPGQRLRAVLYVYFAQLGKPGDDFESWYRQQIERVITTVKSRLDSGELL